MAHFPVIPEGSTPEANRMSEELDVFKTLPNGEVLWRGSFSSLETAKTRINELLVSDPGEYFIHSHPTGEQLFFKPTGHNGHGNGSQYQDQES